MALGRGLSSLIQPKTATGANKEHGTVFHISIEKIAPNPFQPRKHFEEHALEELARSIKEDGVLQPIIVSEVAGGDDTEQTYQIVAGERRWRAAKIAGLRDIPAIIKNVGEEKEGLRIALLENMQREDLNPIELALGLKRLATEFSMRQDDIASRIGKSRQLVGNTIRLLSLPQEIQEDIAAGVVSENHARAMLALSGDELQLKLWREVREHKLSARQTEVAARAYKKIPGRVHAELDAVSRDAAMKLEAHLGTKVTVEPAAHVSDGGKIIVKYFSKEDFKAVVDKILGR